MRRWLILHKTGFTCERFLTSYFINMDTFHLFLNWFSTCVSDDQKYLCCHRLYIRTNTPKFKDLDAREITSLPEVICINPAFTKMIHGTENPKSLLNLQNAQCDTTNFALKGTSTTAKCDSTFPWVYPSVTVRYDFFLRLDNVRRRPPIQTTQNFRPVKAL